MTSLVIASDFLIGLRRLQLNVFSDNARALRLYEAFGFEIEGRHKDFLERGGCYVDAFTMGRITDAQPTVASTAGMNAKIRAALSLIRKQSCSPQRPPATIGGRATPPRQSRAINEDEQILVEEPQPLPISLWEERLVDQLAAQDLAGAFGRGV